VLLKRLQIRALVGRYGNPIPARFLAPIDCSKTPGQDCGLDFFVAFVKGLKKSAE
jgi:hypothetical protein